MIISDVLAMVRRHLWGNFDYLTSPHDHHGRLILEADLIRLAQAVCYSHRFCTKSNLDAVMSLVGLANIASWHFGAEREKSYAKPDKKCRPGD
jgi:hypothetical protein